MKKVLLPFTLGLVASLFVTSTLYAQTNLLKNSDMETQGDWIVNQCEPNASFTVNFGVSDVTPLGGSGKSVELSYKSDGTNPAEVFVYQSIEITPGHTYKLSVAMKDFSSALTDSWIGISYVTSEPVSGQQIEEIKAGLFGTWQDCDGVGFDGLIDTSCATNGNQYFQIPDTITTNTIYFGINVGTWGTTCDIDLVFDNVTLSDSADVGSGINNPDKASQLFSIYPNPSLNGLVYITYKEASNLTYYSVFSILGEKILNGNFNGQTTLDLTDHKKGIYFIRITNSGISETKKLLLE